MTAWWASSKTRAYAKFHHLGDLGKSFLRELEDFFVNYHELDAKKYPVLDACGPKAAHRCIQDGIARYRRKR